MATVSILRPGPGPIAGPPGTPGIPGTPGTPGIPDAPNDGKFYVRQNSLWVVIPAAAAGQITSAAPAGTNRTVWTMMGLNLSVTPLLLATRAIVTCDGQITNSVNNGETDAQLVYGIGIPPINGDPLPAGATLLGSQIRFKATSGGGAFTPFSQSGLITGLTSGQTIWIDLALRVITGNGSLQDIDMLVFEIL
jgi:hypothetical protein